VKRKREVEVRLAAGLLAALAVIMGVGPLLSLTPVQPAQIPTSNHHRSAGAVVNPTGSQNQQREYQFVYDKLNAYLSQAYGSATGFPGSAATTQRFYNYLNFGLPYYHFVGVGRLTSDGVPQLQFYDPANTGQTKWMSPSDVHSSVAANSMQSTTQVMLSCCYGMVNWQVGGTYSNCFATVFDNYLGVISVVGATGTLDDYAALVFTANYYYQIFDKNLAGNLNAAFCKALMDVIGNFSYVYDYTSTVMSYLIGFGVSLVVGAVVSALVVKDIFSLATLAWQDPIVVGFLAGLVTTVVLFILSNVGKAAYIDSLGLNGLQQKLRIGPTPPPGDGDGGGGGKPVPGPWVPA
jgi:hypothetical protein